MISFSKFIEEESPDSTSPPIPGSEDGEEGGTHNDSRVLSKELGISDEDAAEADQCRTYLCHEKIEFPEDGVVVLPPVDVSIEPIDDDDAMYKMTVLATNPRKIQDMNGNDYTGDKLEFIKDVDKEFVEALKAQGWTSVGQPMPGMDGGMPGMGGSLGGAPPMMSHTEYPTFPNWVQLRETGTSTGDVATFSRMTIPLVRRGYPNLMYGKNKKKPYMQPQVED